MATKKTILSIAIDKDLLNRIKELSKGKGLSVSKLISKLIEEALYLEENVFKDDIYQNIDWLSEEWKDKLQVLFTKVLDTTPDPVWIKDLNFRFIYLNKAFEKYYGIKREEAIGKNDVQILSPEVAKECIYTDMKAIERKESTHSIEKVITPEGKEVIFDVIKTPIFDRTGKIIAILGISKDITEFIKIQDELKRKNRELKEAYDKLRNIYEYDVVTGLINRNKFIEDVKNSLNDRISSKYRLITMEIANLIYANEIYGYDFGNKLLKDFAHILKEKLEDEAIDYVFGRLSGNKFGLLIKKNASDIELLKKFNRFLKSIRIKTPDEESFFVPRIIFIAKSISPEEKDDLEKILVYMEDLLSIVKESRKRNFFVLKQYSSIYNRIREMEKKIEEEIKSGVFSPYIKPVVDLNNRSLKGYEVLCEISSDGYLCNNMEEIYIESAFKKIDENILDVVKNKLYPQLEGILFLKLRSSIIELALNVPESKITKDLIYIKDRTFFKVSEDVVLNNFSVIHELKISYNFKFCLDNFGIGNTSIRNLIRFLENDLFEFIKISKYFIKTSMYSHKRKKVLQGVVDVAKEFGIIPIASGIDSEELFNFAKEIGFKYATGKYVGKTEKIIKQHL